MPFYYTPKKIITNKKAFVAATARKLFCITYIMLLRLACAVGRFFKFSGKKNLRSTGGIGRGVSAGEEKIKREQDSILQKCTLGREQLAEEEADWEESYFGEDPIAVLPTFLLWQHRVDYKLH